LLVGPAFSLEFSDERVDFQAIVAQDFATHGKYTEPSTGITFYTSSEANGTITGDGELSTVSWGSFTFGMALPSTALTVDTHEYIGLIVSFDGSATLGSIVKFNFLDWLYTHWKGRMDRNCTW
jgi:hypothetical protein